VVGWTGTANDTRSDVEVRTDRLGVLVDQLVDSKDLSAVRLTGLTAAEYLWEPYSDMWSIRPRVEERTPDAYGPGEWVIDHDRSIDPFAAGPLTTIAWRIGHLTGGFAGRWEWTFGERRQEPKLMIDFSPDRCRHEVPVGLGRSMGGLGREDDRRAT